MITVGSYLATHGKKSKHYNLVFILKTQHRDSLTNKTQVKFCKRLDFKRISFVFFIKPSHTQRESERRLFLL